MLFTRLRALPSFHRNGVRYVSVVEDLANAYVHSREEQQKRDAFRGAEQREWTRRQT